MSEKLREAAGKLIVNCHPAQKIERSVLDQFVSARREHWVALAVAIGEPATISPKSIDRDSVLEEAAKACAQVIADSDKNMDHELGTGFDLGCEECANAIRSLKDTP